MKINFKSKVTVEISDEIVEAIIKGLEKGVDGWQVFKNTKNEIFLIINLKEVEFIA